MLSPSAFNRSDEEYVHCPKTLVRDLNDHITCLLCYGYLVDATVLSECYHCCKFVLTWFYIINLIRFHA